MDANARKLNTIRPSVFVNKMNFIASLIDRNRSFVITMGAVLLAILFGWISTTANLIIISISVAIFLGSFMIARPAWIVWLVLTIGLLLVGIAPLFDERLDSKVGWAVSVLCFILMVLAFFKAFTSQKARQNTPFFIWLLFVFFGYAVINSLVQWHSAEEFIGGFKRYFQIWGLTFAICWMTFDERLIHRWRDFFILAALFQLPFAIYELIAFVPFREGLRNAFPEMVPIDVVAGTFGSTIYGGGNSGEMSTFLVIVLAFLLARRMEKILPIVHFVILSLWILLPLFLGETKSVIIMLPLMFLVLYRRELYARPHYGLMALTTGALCTVSMLYAYMNITQMSLDKLFADTLSYNLYEKGYGTNHLNRTTVLAFWAERQGAQDPISFVFGNGLGSSHQATNGHIDIRFPYYGIGLTSASTLLWDLGIFGAGVFGLNFVVAWHIAGKLYRNSTEAFVRADAAAIQAALALFVFYLFYNRALLENIAIQIVFAFLLGYLAWLYRRHCALMVRRNCS